MAQNKLGIFRQALLLTGVTHTVDSPDENSYTAEVCRIAYDTVLDQVLRGAFWPSARAAARLATLAARDTSADWVSTDPFPGWLYAYAAPADMIAARYISTFGRFSEGVLGTTRTIFSNEEEAILIYTKRLTEPSLWDVSLYKAVYHALAAEICMPLHGKSARAERATQLANQMILQARADTANVEFNQQETVPSWISARGFSGNISPERFIVPYGPLLTSQGAPLV